MPNVKKQNINICTGMQSFASVNRYVTRNGGAPNVQWWQPNMGTARPVGAPLPSMPTMLAAMAKGTGALYVAGQATTKIARGARAPRGVYTYAWRRGARF